jgi:hypothetical protein
VEGKINDQPKDILIDLGASHIFIDPKLVEIFYFQRRKLGKFWFVQLSRGFKRRNNEMVKEFPMDMNGLSTKEDFSIIPLGSYDFLIGMDWLEKHHVVLHCYNKAFTFLDEEGNLRIVQGIPRAVNIIEVSSLQQKTIFKKGFQIFVAHMEETPKDKVPSIEDYVVLKGFKYLFREISGFP